MRIGINFHSFDEYFSGVEYYGLGLIEGLLSIDSENEYFVFTNQPDAVQRRVGDCENVSIIGVVGLGGRVARIVWEQTRLGVMAKRYRLDMVHCLSYICPIRCSEVPFVVTIHDTIALRMPSLCKRTNAVYFGLAMKRGAGKAVRVIAVSKRTAGNIVRELVLDKSRIRVIYPGIDEIFKRDASHEQMKDVRSRYNLPEKYMLYVGNIEPKKNIASLLQMYTSLRLKGLDHKLVLVGKRSWGSRSELAEIKRLISTNDVVCPGYVSRAELRSIYTMAEVFIFPSLYEGFGFPPLEAMSCGTAVVASNRGSLGETLGEAALIVEPFDVDGLVEGVHSVIANQELREKYSLLGTERSKRFRWDKAARETLGLYEEVVH
ncbi:MAG: glycosyltransferase family 4 protein [Planctomycetota bacterium]|jgi:glycosyltransferase involved in cell wall biosynthesis